MLLCVPGVLSPPQSLRLRQTIIGHHCPVWSIIRIFQLSDDQVPYNWTKDSRGTSRDQHPKDEKYNLYGEKTTPEKSKHQADINTNELKKTRNLRIDYCVEKYEMVGCGEEWNPVVIHTVSLFYPDGGTKTVNPNHSLIFLTAKNHLPLGVSVHDF